MKKITINDDIFEFELKDQEEGFELNGSTYQLHSIGQNEIVVIKDGSPLRCTYARVGSNILIDINGVTLEVSSGSGRKKSTHAKGDASRLLAPMPGKVFKVLKQKGDVVKAGEGVIVLEAMKMEHTLKAIKDCTVSNILFSEGDQVTSGAELVHLEIQE